ncbi:type I restriction endonuclease subunit S, partial [Vibrio tubiashii]|nr:type I restriction endonuclease subunit S [Vibrio tubiashii]
LGNVSNVVSGVTKGQKHNNKVIVKAPYMRVANVQAGYLNLNEIKEIEVKESDVEKYKLEVGDVLLTEGGDHDKLGRGAIWNGEVDNCIHQNHVFRVRLDTELYTSQWFNGYLKTDFAKRYFLKCAKKTTNLASINITQLKGLPMPDIDIKEQVRFEKIITSINSQMLSNTELAHQYDENFNALMQKAFKGELNL